jgi:hypothetical protein
MKVMATNPDKIRLLTQELYLKMGFCIVLKQNYYRPGVHKSQAQSQCGNDILYGYA